MVSEFLEFKPVLWQGLDFRVSITQHVFGEYTYTQWYLGPYYYHRHFNFFFQHLFTKQLHAYLTNMYYFECSV